MEKRYRGEQTKWPVYQTNWMTAKIVVLFGEYQRDELTTRAELKTLFDRFDIRQDLWIRCFKKFMLDDMIKIGANCMFSKKGYPLYALNKELKQSPEVKVFPPVTQIFNFTKAPLVENISVILLGQEPYCQNNEAHGLAFSTLSSVLPGSLKIIFTALEKYGHGHPPNGNLSGWCEEGVLLINTCLTTRQGIPGSHCMTDSSQETILWELAVATALNEILNSVLDHPVVILCFGTANFLDKFVQVRKDHLVLYNKHPSHQKGAKEHPFLGKDSFGDANRFLAKKGRQEIRWSRGAY